jgi:pterin-4a-carbinolamine dehydratase
LDFALHIGLMADREKFVPIIVLERGRVTVSWSTGGFKDLRGQGFVCAGKTDEIYRAH